MQVKLQSQTSTKNIQSIERMHAILSCFKTHDELSLTEISTLVGLHKSTTNGIVTTLKNLQYLEQITENGKYRLGIEIFRLNSCSKLTEVDIYAPYIRQLSKETNETITLHLWKKDTELSTTVVSMTESTHSVKYVTTIGTQIPLHCSAVGKAILAQIPAEKRRNILSLSPLKPMSAHSITNIEALNRQFEEINQIGYAFNMEETEDGVIGIGIALCNKNGIPHAGIGIAAPNNRITTELGKKYGNLLLETKAQITKDFCKDNIT